MISATSLKDGFLCNEMISCPTTAELCSQCPNHFFLHGKTNDLGREKRNIIPHLDWLVKRNALIWLIFQESKSCLSKPSYSFHEERQNLFVV